MNGAIATMTQIDTFPVQIGSKTQLLLLCYMFFSLFALVFDGNLQTHNIAPFFNVEEQ